MIRRLSFSVALLLALSVAVPAVAVDHTQVVPRGHETGHDRGGHDHDRDVRHDRDRGRFHRGPSVGLYFGAPAYISPPPVYYGPSYPYAYGGYPYAPVPITGVYRSPYGYYCRDYRTSNGIETACLQPDGVWRFIN